MEIEYQGKTISFTKELTIYDHLAMDFSRILQNRNVDHVFVAGYVAILFGRSRTSEDIDVLVKQLSMEDFKRLWRDLDENFYCHNTGKITVAYNEYLSKKLAIRFSRKDEIIPNIEFKWASTEHHKNTLQNPLTVILGDGSIPISALENQIAYKLYLGSDKDIEDARYLFELFREHIDENKLNTEIAGLAIPARIAKTKLGW